MQRVTACVDGQDFNIVMPKKLPDTHLLYGIVLYHKEPFAARLSIVLDLLQRFLHALRSRRFRDK
jgi:hypothetical protein